MADDAGAINFGCFVSFSEKANYNGEQRLFTGARTLNSFNKPADFPTESWNDKFKSVTTGDSAWVKLFKLANCSGDVLHLSPNTAIANLNDCYVNDQRFGSAGRSMQVFAERPDGWPGGYVGEYRGAVMTNLRRSSINRTVRGFVSDVVGMVPVAGDVLSMAFDAFWPFGPSKADIWDSLQDWASMAVRDAKTRATGHRHETTIDGLGGLIRYYLDNPSEHRFEGLYQQLIFVEPEFTKSAAPGETIGYLLLYGTIALSVYRAAWLDYDGIYKEHSEAGGKAERAAHLTAAIKRLRDAVLKAYEAARDYRLGLVNYTDHGVSFAHHWNASDDYSGWASPDCDTERRGAQEVDFFRGQHAGPTLDAEFAVFLEIADIWTYFDLEAPPKPLPTVRKTVTTGMWGRPRSYGPRGHEPHSFRVEASDGGRIEMLKLHADKGGCVTGVEFTITGKKSELWGHTGSQVKDLRFAEGEAIQAIFGAFGAMVDHVSVRYGPTSKAGEPTAYPTEDGLGESTGGIPFSASGADGGYGVMVGLTCQLETSNLLALGAVWAVDRVEPRT